MLFLIFSAFAESPAIPNTEPLKVIDTPYFQLVFPQSAEHLAQRSAAALDNMMQEIFNNRKKSFRKLHVTLNHLHPNAFVDVALFPLQANISAGLSNNHPFRKGQASSWLDTYMFDIAWETFQYDRSFAQGLLLYWILWGDSGWNLTHTYALPKWFLEGEKRLYSQLWMGSSAKMPRQKSRLVAYVEESGHSSFHQIIMGSHTRFLPALEESGMQMVEYGLETFSNKLWSNSVLFAVSTWYTPYPLESAIMKFGSTNFEQLYKGTTDKIKTEWNEGRETRYENAIFPLFPSQSTNLHHHYPKKDSTGALYYVQDGLSDTGSIQKRENPSAPPQKIIQLGQQTDRHFDVFEGYLIWTEQKTDLIWKNKASQDLILYDMEAKRKYQLSKDDILYNPIFSPDGSEIAVFSRKQDGFIELQIRNNNGGLLTSKTLDIGDHFDLFWGDELCWVHKSIDEGNRILCMDRNTLEPYTKKDWTWISISDPLLYQQNLLYISSQPSGEELHAWDGHQLYRVSASTYGVFHPFIEESSSEILLVEYRDKGQTLVKQPLIPKLWEPISLPIEEHPPVPQYIPYDSKPYGRWNGLLQIHSWSPFYNLINGKYSLGIYSTNYRKSLGIRANTIWDSINETLSYDVQATYSEFWPEVSLIVEYGEKSKIITPSVWGSGEVGITWDTTRWGTQISLPFYMQNGAFQGKTSIQCSFFQENNEHHTISNTALSFDKFGVPVGNQNQINLGITSRFVQDQAIAHIAPPLGIEGRIEAQQNISSTGGVFLDGTLWLPSLIENHSISFRGGYTNLPFHRDVPSLLPLGTPNRIFDGISFLDARYSLPLAYPNFEMDGWMFLRRVRGSVFVQHSVSKDRSDTTYGIQLNLDAHILRFSIPLPSLGIDIAYHQQDSRIIILPHLQMYKINF